ncbi:hypothetical protein [Helicobacter sp. 11S02629-2]|uniref:CiaD-like domain-containing protein n=1 Tax=Helicobacter sp. 11S02629-2 TaxID=1476195 RepID=UPI000BA62678|nr:hypothetical protein [Helicobacter sp. 11S02629-2]PAF45368.1 hypothetical protein BKH40_04030 [Helicobacter sp. 11S02629-2]
MELKDVVLQTLNELENAVDERGYQDIGINANAGEAEFLHALKERLFVLFEGIKPSSDDDEIIEIQTNDRVKLNMICNFLQFQLALIDARLELIEGSNK